MPCEDGCAGAYRRPAIALQRFHSTPGQRHARLQRWQQLPEQLRVVEQPRAIQIAPLRGADAAHGDHERGAADRGFTYAQQRVARDEADLLVAGGIGTGRSPASSLMMVTPASCSALTVSRVDRAYTSSPPARRFRLGCVRAMISSASPRANAASIPCTSWRRAADSDGVSSPATAVGAIVASSRNSRGASRRRCIVGDLHGMRRTIR